MRAKLIVRKMRRVWRSGHIDLRIIMIHLMTTGPQLDFHYLEVAVADEAAEEEEDELDDDGDA